MYISNRDINPDHVRAMYFCKTRLWGRRLDISSLIPLPKFAHRPLPLLRLVVEAVPKNLHVAVEHPEIRRVDANALLAKLNGATCPIYPPYTAPRSLGYRIAPTLASSFLAGFCSSERTGSWKVLLGLLMHDGAVRKTRRHREVAYAYCPGCKGRQRRIPHFPPATTYIAQEGAFHRSESESELALNRRQAQAV